MAACGYSGMTASTTSSARIAETTSRSSTTLPSTTATSTTPSDDSQAIAKDLKAAIPQIGAIVEITEDNDENNLIGRPGQYKGLSIDCGAKLERWPSKADAQARAADIQKKLKAYGLGAEYDYVRDRMLLRVPGALKPSQAKAYETNFLG
jgi:hypothetical protein